MSDADDQMGGHGGQTGLDPTEQNDKEPDPVKGNTSQSSGAGPESDKGGGSEDDEDLDDVDEASADSFPASDPPAYR
jgi:hypothetical protein